VDAIANPGKKGKTVTQLLQASTIHLNPLETVTNLQEVVDLQFFPEWQIETPQLTDWERESCDRIKVRLL